MLQADGAVAQPGTQAPSPRLPISPGLPSQRSRSRLDDTVRAPRPLLSRVHHKGYMFRARRTVDGKPDEGGGKFVETKYRCRACSHEWWERIPAPVVPPPADRPDAA